MANNLHLPDIAPVILFTATPTSGAAPLTVQFIDASPGSSVTAWAWTFGDGASSTVQNPSHTYGSSGYYHATLTISNSIGLTNTTSKEITVIAVSDNSTFAINGTDTNAGIITINTALTTSNGTIVTLSNADKVITLTNLDGNGWDSFVITTDGVSHSTPDTMSGHITGIVATTKPVLADLGGDVGDVELSIELNLDTMPAGDATLLQELVTNSSRETRTAFQQVALNHHLTIKEIAYVAKLIKDNFLYSNPATIKMAVSGDGVIKQMGVNPATIPDTGVYLSEHKSEVEQKIRIFRTADDGSTELLTTRYVTYIAPKAYFEADSPHGLSTFGLASVETVSPSSVPDSTTNSWSGSISGSSDDGPTSIANTAGISKTEIVNVGGKSAVTRAELTGTGLGKNLVITAMPKSILPATIAAPPTIVYQYLSITSSTITGTVNEITLDFSVPQSWLTEHGYTSGDIVMMHNTGGQWQTLNTQFVSKNNGNVLYRATTPSFSYFAIAYQKGGTILGEGTFVPTTFATAGGSVTHAPTSPFAINPDKTKIIPSAPVLSPVEGIPMMTIIVGIAGVIVIVGAFLVRRWWIHRQNPALFRDYD